MKLADIKQGIWVRFNVGISIKGDKARHNWHVGEIALVKGWNGDCGTFVSSADPKKTEMFYAGIWRHLEDLPVPNPFESGPGIRELPTGREPFVAEVSERDLLPDV